MRLPKKWTVKWPRHTSIIQMWFRMYAFPYENYSANEDSNGSKITDDDSSDGPTAQTIDE